MNGSPTQLMNDWHDRYVDDRFLRWILRRFAPHPENPVWGAFLRKLRHHRHGLSTNAILGTWALAAICAFIPSYVFSYHVWFLIYLCYLPAAAIRTGQLIEKTHLATELELTPQGKTLFVQARTAMILLLVVVASVPPVIYGSMKALGFGHRLAQTPLYEVAFLLGSIATMAFASALSMRGWKVLVGPLILVTYLGYRLLFPRVTIETLIFNAGSHQDSLFLPTVIASLVATGVFLGAVAVVRYQPKRSP